ncbi:hypothetical protein FRC12_016810 [Ceratobasidium sp. 428]|nr:hypothetical protein FRC12_016810 [Ceratobasidium sp. 428]
MQHVFSLGSVFRASPFVNYHHQPQMDGPAITPVPDPPKDPTPPPPPPPQQKLLIKLRVSDLGSKPRPSTSSDVDESAVGPGDDLDVEAPPPAATTTKRRGGGAGTRGKRRKVDGGAGPGTPTSDDGHSTVAWDSGTSVSGTPTKRGRGGKGSRGGGTGRGRGGRKSGLQHQVLPVPMPIPGTPDSVGELSLRPASPSSESTSANALTPTPISTPTISIPTSSLALPPTSLPPAPLSSQPAEIDPALLATAPRRPLPTRSFPVQAAPKTTQPTITANGASGAGNGMDLNRRRVRRWGVKMREVRGVGGGSWWVRTWVGSSESEYASDPSRILSVPTTLPRPSTSAPKPRKTDSSRSVPTIAKIKLEVPAPPPMGTFSGTSHYRERDHKDRDLGGYSKDRDQSGGGGYKDREYKDRDQEGVELLTAFASAGSSSSSRQQQGKNEWGGIGGKHYREREHYRGGGESSGTSTPGGSGILPLVAPSRVIKYDLATDGIEEVAPPPPPPVQEDGKGKGREVIIVNGSGNGSGKGKEREREDEVVVSGGSGPGPVVERALGGAGAEGRTRSGSGFEQAAKDVEMELMGDT